MKLGRGAGGGTWRGGGEENCDSSEGTIDATSACLPRTLQANSGVVVAVVAVVGRLY